MDQNRSEQPPALDDSFASPTERRYYLDCEFNGAGGELLSMALRREGGGGLYWINGWTRQVHDPWVAENVIPILRDCPAEAIIGDLSELPGAIEHCFLAWGDLDPIIVTDWPDDIKYFAESVLTGPGTMIRLRSLRIEMHRVDAYPTTLMGAVQHNAWWDALALEHRLLGAGDAKLSSTATP